MMGNDVAHKIEGVLSPLVGQVLARAAIDLEAKRIGKDSDTITYGDINALSDHLTRHLSPFVGAQIAEAAARQVRGIC
ncbi:MAG: hypothetical protein VB139_06610 [Coriobacteriia bacterium]|nr:hypothetical protein [Coriobacteriia bacterium]